MSPEQEQYKLEEALEAESHLLGRVTYEGFAAAWPERSGPFADKINSMPKHVVSSTLSEPLEWNNSHLVKGDVAAGIAKLKERDGGPILVAGSCTLVHSLIEEDLVDELRLMVFPVAIGGGKRPFPESGKKKSFALACSCRPTSRPAEHRRQARYLTEADFLRGSASMEASGGDVEAAALAALKSDAGCTDSRARALVQSVGKAVTAEALEVVAGSTQAFGSALDRRVATLDRIIGALDDGEPLPTDYEVGVVFRITPAQARNVLRTYQARFSEHYRGRLQGALDGVRVKRERHDDTNVFVFDFDDPAVLEYAAEKLRRRGLSRSVVVDRVKLEVVVDRDEKDRLDKPADEALKGT